mmetsp:Transcript_20986/g.58356  ORF Transcript_20986/g.58356 Transcript_20986/m.58356 type:complete len:81 (-) Transcript_20986:94-336(-)
MNGRTNQPNDRTIDLSVEAVATMTNKTILEIFFQTLRQNATGSNRSSLRLLALLVVVLASFYLSLSVVSNKISRLVNNKF